MFSLRQLMCLSRSFGRPSIQNITGRCRYMCSKKNIEDRIEKQPITLIETESTAKTTKPTSHIDWDKEFDQIIEDEELERKRSILAPVEDESKIYAEPMLRPSLNLAAYVQKSETLQQFIKLGVNLNKLDAKNVGQFIAGLDFKRDVEAHILLLTKDIGVPVEQLGNLITKNPHIFKQSLDDIQVRVNYLLLKRFTQDKIVTIITRNPNWLNYYTRDIDKRLGFFQKHFGLDGNEVRLLTVGCPRLITYDQVEVQKISFSIREECTFTEDEVKQIVLKCPKIWMMHRYDLMQRYDYILNHMHISNSQLAKQPYILTNRLFRIKERHGFLKKIGRAQYDPKLELYVPLDNLCLGTDEEFVERTAKRPYEEYDRYLRTL